MPDIRRKVNALYPPIREEICDHQHTPYRAAGGMPCTGPLICTMCGMLFRDHDERDAAREAARHAITLEDSTHA